MYLCGLDKLQSYWKQNFIITGHTGGYMISLSLRLKSLTLAALLSIACTSPLHADPLERGLQGAIGGGTYWWCSKR